MATLYYTYCTLYSFIMHKTAYNMHKTHYWKKKWEKSKSRQQLQLHKHNHWHVKLTYPAFTVLLTKLYHMQCFYYMTWWQERRKIHIVFCHKDSYESLFVVNQDAKNSTTTCQNTPVKQDWLLIGDTTHRKKTTIMM